MGLDVPVRDTEFVKTPEALDEAPADLGDSALKLVRSDREVIHDGVHFGSNGPRPGLRVEQIKVAR